MKFQICVPIPIKSASIGENENLIKKVMDLNPNIIELRLDYIKDIQNITKDFVTDLINRIQPEIPVICTFRDYSEGGQIQIDLKDRIKIMKTIIESHPKYIDLEINIEKEILGELVRLASHNKTNIIFSSHNFENTPT